MKSLQAHRDEHGGGSPFSSDPLHHFNVSQQARPALPHAAVLAKVIPAGQDVELDHAEHPIAVLDKNTEPGKNTNSTTTQTKTVLISVFSIRYREREIKQ